MNARNFFSCLSLALCLLITGCCHLPPRTSLAVPSQEFRYSFDQAPFISPRIIENLMTWISDPEDQVVAINVLGAQDSNRYYGDTLVTNVPMLNVMRKHPFVYCHTTTGKGDQTIESEFGYHFIGRTRSGIYVLLTIDWEGGTGYFENLLLVTFERDQSITCDWDKGTVRDGGQRLLIKKVGEISLGDRWDGELKVEGNSIVIGKDIGWFTLGGGEGHGNKRVLQINLAR